MAVSDYMIGHLTVKTRATANSWQRGQAWVRLLLAEIRMIFQCLIGEQTGQPALLGYQQSSFRTVYPKIHPMEVYTPSLIELRSRLKQRKKRQAIRMLQ